MKRKSLGKYTRTLIDGLEIKVPAIDPFEYMMKLAGIINASEKVKSLAIDILNDIATKHIPAGKNPMAVAASVLYICCKKSGYYATQQDIAKAAGITDVTLRNRFIELEKKKVLHFNYTN